MSIELETSVPVDPFAAYEAIHLFPQAEVEPPTPPPLNTAQDLLEWVLNDPLRNKNQRRNEAAAIKWLGKVDSTLLSAIPLDVRYLVDNRIKLIRQHAPLKKMRRSNIITLAEPGAAWRGHLVDRRTPRRDYQPRLDGL